MKVPFHQRPIAYEPHPVSPERKAELRAKGMRIVDIRFKPQEAEKPKPRRKVKDGS